MENESPTTKKRRLATERKQRWRARQSQETVNRIREEDAARQANRKKQESMDMTQARRASSSLYLAIRQVTDFFFRTNRFSFDVLIFFLEITKSVLYINFVHRK
jgi:hypothetical protein